MSERTPEREPASEPWWAGDKTGRDPGKELNELRRAVAALLGCDPETWPEHGNAPLAIAASLALRVKRDPAPAEPTATKGADVEALRTALDYELRVFGAAYAHECREFNDEPRNLVYQIAVNRILALPEFAALLRQSPSPVLPEPRGWTYPVPEGGTMEPVNGGPLTLLPVFLNPTGDATAPVYIGTPPSPEES